MCVCVCVHAASSLSVGVASGKGRNGKLTQKKNGKLALALVEVGRSGDLGEGEARCYIHGGASFYIRRAWASCFSNLEMLLAL